MHRRLESTRDCAHEFAKVQEAVAVSIAQPPSGPKAPVATPLARDEAHTAPREHDVVKAEVTDDIGLIKEPTGWRRLTTMAHDVVSDRTISIRRIDYTTAVLQGAAAGAILTVAISAMLRSM